MSLIGSDANIFVRVAGRIVINRFQNVKKTLIVFHITSNIILLQALKIIHIITSIDVRKFNNIISYGISLVSYGYMTCEFKVFEMLKFM
jgi:hypothetical protein